LLGTHKLWLLIVTVFAGHAPAPGAESTPAGIVKLCVLGVEVVLPAWSPNEIDVPAARRGDFDHPVPERRLAAHLRLHGRPQLVAARRADRRRQHEQAPPRALPPC
jgi:hypothetical protein